PRDPTPPASSSPPHAGCPADRPRAPAPAPAGGSRAGPLAGPGGGSGGGSGPVWGGAGGGGGGGGRGRAWGEKLHCGRERPQAIFGPWVSGAACSAARAPTTSIPSASII